MTRLSITDGNWRMTWVMFSSKSWFHVLIRLVESSTSSASKEKTLSLIMITSGSTCVIGQKSCKPLSTSILITFTWSLSCIEIVSSAISLNWKMYQRVHRLTLSLHCSQLRDDAFGRIFNWRFQFCLRIHTHWDFKIWECSCLNREHQGIESLLISPNITKFLSSWH